MTAVQDAIDAREARQRQLIMTPFRRMVNDLVMQRVAYKLMKDWKRADEIRDRLRSYGFDLNENKRDTMIYIPDTNCSWWITTDLKSLAEQNGEMSGFVPHNPDLPPIDLEAEAEWYRQKEANNESN